MIDAHQHFWKINRADCAWPTPDLDAIYRDFLPADLRAIALDCGVTSTVLVQSQPCDSDTDFLLSLAANDELIGAVVGWVDLLSPAAPARIAALATHKKLRGLRPMLQGLAADDWILQSALEPAISAMQAHHLTFDALVFTRHLPHLFQFAQRYPQLRLVIDHAAKPPIAAANQHHFAQWREAMARLAQLPQVYCKLSGLLTEANAAQGEADLLPYAEHIFRCFGAHRLMWGSDWPVLGLSANRQYSCYADWVALAKGLMSAASPADIAQIFSRTAREFYGF